MEGEGDLKRKIKGPSFIKLGYRIIAITASKCWQGECAREWGPLPPMKVPRRSPGETQGISPDSWSGTKPETTVKARNLPALRENLTSSVGLSATLL